MRRMKQYGILLLVCMCFILACCSCSNRAAETFRQEKQEYKIVLLGKESYVYSDAGFIHGMELAIEEVKEDVDITWEHVDDRGEYETGLLYGGQLAADESVLAVFTFQDFEVMEALAPEFEKAKKPLVSVQGCYESTLNEGYNYFISAFTSANDMGTAMAQYSRKQGRMRVACSHTDTTFELSEMQGFQQEAYEQGVSVVDMVQGPNTVTELKDTYDVWEKLGTDAVYLAQYTYSDTEWMMEIIKFLKQKNPDLLIMSDYSLNNAETLKNYGSWLEGVVIPAPYSIETSRLTKELEKKYEKEYKIPMSNVAVQGFDLVKLFAGMIKNGYTDSSELIKQIKREEGYNGVSGNIKFAVNGKMEGIKPQYLIVKDSRFVTVEE